MGITNVKSLPGRSRTIRHARTVALASISLTLGLAACGSSGGNSAAGTGSKNITVGMASVLSGPDSDLAQVDNGAIAYLKYVNAAGGINGYHFTYPAADTQFTASGSLAAIRKLIAGGAQAIMGVGTAATLALKPIAAKEFKVPIFMAGDGGNFTPPVINMFDIGPNYNAMYPAMYAAALKLTKNQPVGVIYENDGSGLPALTSIPKYVSAEGVKPPAKMVAASATATDCTPYMSKMQQAHVKAVVLATVTTLAACMVKGAASIGYSPKWVGDWALDSPTYKQLLGSQYQGQYLLDYNESISSGSAPAKLYIAQMKKYDPDDLTSSFSEQGWDMAAVLVQAVEKVTKGGNAFSGTALLRVLNSSFNGEPAALVSSGVTYNSEGHYGILHMAEFQTVAAGGDKQVSPFTALPRPYGSS
jgi:branched-chain amino acid transport system substrate-binding protein